MRQYNQILDDLKPLLKELQERGKVKLSIRVNEEEFDKWDKTLFEMGKTNGNEMLLEATISAFIKEQSRPSDIPQLEIIHDNTIL